MSHLKVKIISDMDRRKRSQVPSCVHCTLAFSFKDAYQPLGMRCPLLLQCGHPICEGCVKSLIKGNANVECNICSTVSEASKSPPEVRDYFPLSTYIVGQVALKKLVRSKIEDNTIKFCQRKDTMGGNHQCVECKTSNADCECLKCGGKLCNTCFDKIHSRSVILQSHVKSPLKTSPATVVFSEEFLCKEHGSIKTVYCAECSEYCCKQYDCFKSHLQHRCHEITEKNEELLPEFNQAFEEASEVLKRLYTTHKKIKSEKGKIEDEEALEIEKKVMAHFTQLHGLLQIQEDMMLKQIHGAQELAANSLADVVIQLEDNIQEMENILCQCKAALKNPSSLPLIFLYDKLKNISEMPCHLVQSGLPEASKFQFNTNEDIVENLKTHCSITIPESREFELKSKSNLSDDYLVEPIPNIIPEFNAFLDRMSSVNVGLPSVLQPPQPPQLPQVEIKTKKVNTHMQELLRKNNHATKNTVVQEVPPISFKNIEALTKVSPLVEGMAELVQICHLNSPSSFYVQRKSVQTHIYQITQHFSKQSNINKSSPEDVKLGEQYIVQYSADKKWYRGIIKEINNDKFTVFFVDYGNVEVTSKMKLREMPVQLKRLPPFANHCRLIGCTPLGGKQWTREATQTMVNLTKGKELMMIVERSIPTCDMLEVRLKTLDESEADINQALKFLNCAQSTESVNSVEGIFKKKPQNKTGKFYNQETVKIGETFNAIVSHIVSPSHFYIQQIKDGSKHHLIPLTKEMNRFYSSRGSDNLLLINPTIDLAVAVWSSKDKNWYRGVVREIPRPQTVTIQYIDFGHQETLLWSNIKVLDKRFLKIATLALKCKLSEIVPIYDQGWTVKAKNAFEELAPKEKLISVYVEDIDNSVPSVLLYDCQQFKKININGMLVQMGHAKSTGPSSGVAEYCHEEAIDENATAESLDVPVSFYENSTSSTSQLSLWNAALFKDDASIKTESSMTLTVDSSLHETETEELETEYKNNYKDHFKIEIVKVVSPAEIYFFFSNQKRNETTKDLITEMSIFYKDSPEEERIWQENDPCAVFRTTDKKWYRGLIVEVLTESCKISMKDIGGVEVVKTTNMRELVPQFWKAPQGCYKCYLAEITPPGGQLKWPMCTTDLLKLTISNYSDLYIKKSNLEYSEEKGMPVFLLAKVEEDRGPLAPVKDEWVDINKTLLNAGLALPERKPIFQKSTEFNDSPALLEDKPLLGTNESQFDAQKPAIYNWLQTEFEGASAQLLTDSEKCDDDAQDELEDPRAMKRATPKREDKNKRQAFIPAKQKGVAKEPIQSLVPRLPPQRPKITEWLPAEPFSSLEFDAMPTYVDYSCSIYIQDYKKSQESLLLLQRGLHACFGPSKAKPQDLIWSKGEICCAKFHQDKNWYRGKVLEVQRDVVKVFFVDYGNVEDIEPHDLRKEVPLSNIPIQCHRCRVDGINPLKGKDGSWPISTLDFIHMSVVEKVCHVMLNPPMSTGDEYIILELTLPGGEDLFQSLLSMGLIIWRHDAEATGAEPEEQEEFIVEQDVTIARSPFKSVPAMYEHGETTGNVNAPVLGSEKISNINWYDKVEQEKRLPCLMQLKYKELFIPYTLLEMKVHVTAIKNCNTVSIIIDSCDDKQISDMIIEFAKLQERIQTEAENSYPLVKPVVGLPCISCYTDDSIWYRAEIKRVINDNRVLVRYVDFGNEEEIDTNRLREIKEDFMHLAAQSQEVVLHKIVEGPKFDQKTVDQMMMACFQPDFPYLMTIENRKVDEDMSVEIFNENGEKPYQHLIDMDLLAVSYD